MANFDDIGAVCALGATEVTKMTNPQLKKALSTLLNAESGEQASNNILLDEIRGLRKQVDELGNLKQELQNVKQEVNCLSNRLDEAFKVITQQQLFLETMDGKERRRNMLIFGLIEEAGVIGDSDIDKVGNVIRATGYKEAFDPSSWEIKRLGKSPMIKLEPRKDQYSSLLKMGRPEMKY